MPLAVAAAEVGSLFCVIVLIMGPLWGRKAWGTFWTWDPRLTTTVHISGGNMVIERVQLLHAPAAFICGENDIADPNCATDFEAADTPVFYGRFMGGDHLGILFGDQRAA